MKFTIIVPVFNAEKYIQKCIESVISQDYKDFELLLIDDGSTDLSSNICEKSTLLDNRIKYFKRENKGVSAARNFGIDMSNGDYLWFLDSDDFIEKNSLSALARATDKLKENEMVAFNYYRVYESNKRVKNDYLENITIDVSKDFHKEERFKYFFARSYGIQIWNKIYSSKFLKENKIYFDESLKVGEDFLFNFNVIHKIRKIHRINEYHYNYLIREGSITTSFKEGLFDQNQRILLQMSTLTKDNINYRDIVSIYAYVIVDNLSLNARAKSMICVNDIHSFLLKLSKNELFNESMGQLRTIRLKEYTNNRKWYLFVELFTYLYVKKQYLFASLLMQIRCLV